MRERAAYRAAPAPVPVPAGDRVVSRVETAPRIGAILGGSDDPLRLHLTAPPHRVSAPGAGPAAPPNFSLVRVFYATNRAAAATSGGEGRFLNESGPLTYGTLTVTVPRSHLPGAIERPQWLVAWVRSPNPEHHFTIESLTPLSRAQLLQSIAGQMRHSAPGHRAVLVFIHGFNVGFDDAAFRTAQISHDIGFAGVPVFYSWPSEHSLSPLGYSHDASRIEESRPYIKNFIADIVANGGADDVFILAHSMGTRAVTRALAELAAERPDLTRRIKALILAAPDINRTVFQNDVAPRLKAMAARATLYASREDRALKASREFAGASALGDATGAIGVFDGMDSIDATEAGTSFLGHSDYGDSPALLRDIRAILAGSPAARRPWLRPERRAGQTYYIFHPAH
jgi:esterase/lipase superfamily enzyme